MIKYLGSKRRLVPVLGAMATASGATTAIDLFTGTTRVAQELKRRGLFVTAVDSARYSEVFARGYIETDGAAVDAESLRRYLEMLAGLPGVEGYVTEVFCGRSRYFHPKNGMRIDAIRDRIERDHAGTALYPIVLTSLIEAADRVDSTTGVQMAFLKKWAPRALNDLELRIPELLPGPGRALRCDAVEAVGALPDHDLAYLDPPYNQHRYAGNYHVWETLVAWDSPEHYGVACKRIELRNPGSSSVFNRRREMPGALRKVIEEVPARLVIVSFNDEGWVTLDDLREMAASRGHVEVLAFDSARYVGARIGIHNRDGVRVGNVSHLRNTEYLVVCGERGDVEAAVDGTRCVSAG